MLTTSRINAECRPKKSFFIKDILKDYKPKDSDVKQVSVSVASSFLTLSQESAFTATGKMLAARQAQLQQQHSPLDQLMRLTKNTLQGLHCDVKNADADTTMLSSLWVGKAGCLRRRRKTRTAFTARQLASLEERFLIQRYLTPSSRDELASSLGLSNAQVITWFQNRRAKLKREAEEQRRDLQATTTKVPHIMDDDGTTKISGMSPISVDVEMDDDTNSVNDVDTTTYQQFSDEDDVPQDLSTKRKSND